MQARLATTTTPIWVATLLCVGPLGAQETTIAWIGLYEPAMLGWLENENRIGELCPDPATLDVCYARSLEPMVVVTTLHAEPSEAGAVVGEVVVVAVPGRGLSAHYRPAGAAATNAVVLDLFLQDWGYGPYFHQTLAERRGDWFQLPAGPWPTPVWLHRAVGLSETILMPYEGEILEMDGNGWYVAGVEPDALLLRPEQPADMWCEGDEPPPVATVTPTRMPRERLLDEAGHLRIRPKYMKGC
jgi:hypothetical protein